MAVDMVERELKGIAMSDLAGASSSRSRLQRPTLPRYADAVIRSTFAPEDGRCMCLFEANSANDVKRLNEEANIPFTRVVEALDLTRNACRDKQCGHPMRRCRAE
jgi:hypothetical protein